MQADRLVTVLSQMNIPVIYGRTKDLPADPPYLIYLGAGQTSFGADDTYYWRNDTYQVEYYYKLKNSETEAALEDLFLENGLLYQKSEDVYIDEGEFFVIYYTIN